MRKRKQVIKWIIVTLLLLLFFDITESVFENEIYLFDKTVYHVVSIFQSEPMTFFLKIVTQLGSAVPIITICIAAFIFLKNKREAQYITSNLIIIFLLNQLMKHIFQRPRPTQHRIINEAGYSFPSGHSMVSMAFYGFFIYLIYKKVENRTLKIVLSTLLGVLIILIGVSRVYLGAHYASDVVGGFCFSIAYLIIYTNSIKKITLQNKVEEKEKRKCN